MLYTTREVLSRKPTDTHWVLLVHIQHDATITKFDVETDSPTTMVDLHSHEAKWLEPSIQEDSPQHDRKAHQAC